MAAETPTPGEGTTDASGLGEYVSPSMDFLVIFVITVAIALLGVAIVFP